MRQIKKEPEERLLLNANDLFMTQIEVAWLT
jgi:hypothetical protein